MRSGSPAQDDGRWPSSQRPRSEEATSNPVRYGSGPGRDPQEGPGGRREVPFGPEISWPYGFRQMDPESRQVLESAYGTGPGYSQPAVDDYGYGDPGYADPSYEGPRTPRHPATARGPRRSSDAVRCGLIRHPPGGVPGYHLPEIRESARPGYASPGYQPQGFTSPSGGQEIWPVTGAQEALRDTGPQPIAPPGLRPPARLTRISGTTTRAWTTGCAMTRGTTSRAPAGHDPKVRRPSHARPIRGSRA